jgi:hypothetical protein
MFATFAWFPSAAPRTRDHGSQLGRRMQAPTQGFRSPSTFNNKKVGIVKSRNKQRSRVLDPHMNKAKYRLKGWYYSTFGA